MRQLHQAQVQYRLIAIFSHSLAGGVHIFSPSDSIGNDNTFATIHGSLPCLLMSPGKCLVDVLSPNLEEVRNLLYLSSLYSFLLHAATSPFDLHVAFFPP